MVCLRYVTVSCLFDAAPQGSGSARTSAVHVSLSSDSIVKQRRPDGNPRISERRGRRSPATLEAEPPSLRSTDQRRNAREAREGPNRAGRVSGVVVDGRCIAPGSFGCQQPIQKKFEKLHFSRKTGLLRRTIRRTGAHLRARTPAPNLGHDRQAWSDPPRRPDPGPAGFNCAPRRDRPVPAP